MKVAGAGVPVPSATVERWDTMSEQPGPYVRTRSTVGVRDRPAPVVLLYGRFYGPMALLGLAITFVPLFAPVVEDDGRVVRSYGSMWETGGDAPALGLLASFILVGLLVAATLSRSGGFGLPLAIAVWTWLPLLMLVSKFGIRDPKPDLTPVGDLALGLMIGLMMIAVVHAVHAWAARTR